MNIAFIPARTGSKRIPKKNKKIFLGKEMILWPIDCLKEADFIGDIYVSTDDQDIAEIANRSNVNVFHRSEKFADDYATSIDALWEFKNSVEIDFENIIMVYPTTPILHLDYLSKGLDIITNNPDFSCLYTIKAFEHKIQRALQLSASGAINPLNDKIFFQRTQDQDNAYFDAANFYIFNKKFFYDNSNSHLESTYGMVLPRGITTFDIDDNDDWLEAEKYLLK